MFERDPPSVGSIVFHDKHVERPTCVPSIANETLLVAAYPLTGRFEYLPHGDSRLVHAMPASSVHLPTRYVPALFDSGMRPVAYGVHAHEYSHPHHPHSILPLALK